MSADVRRALYWDLFGGAFGHTYGHHSVWQFWGAGRTAVNNPLMPWTEAIDQPGARQMRQGRALLESRPFLSRVPEPDLVAAAPVPTSVPGAGRYRFAATRDAAGTWGMVYAPVGRPFTVRLDALRAARLRGWWFNPRTGEATAIGIVPGRGERRFVPPDPGELLDWALVLDDVSKGCPRPGVLARVNSASDKLAR